MHDFIHRDALAARSRDSSLRIFDSRERRARKSAPCARVLWFRSSHPGWMRVAEFGEASRREARVRCAVAAARDDFFFGNGVPIRRVDASRRQSRVQITRLRRDLVRGDRRTSRRRRFRGAHRFDEFSDHEEWSPRSPSTRLAAAVSLYRRREVFRLLHESILTIGGGRENVDFFDVRMPPVIETSRRTSRSRAVE